MIQFSSTKYYIVFRSLLLTYELNKYIGVTETEFLAARQMVLVKNFYEMISVTKEFTHILEDTIIMVQNYACVCGLLKLNSLMNGAHAAQCG